MVDLILCGEFCSNGCRLSKAFGVDIIAVHTGADQQQAGRTPLEDLKGVKQYAKAVQVAVAGESMPLRLSGVCSA